MLYKLDEEQILLVESERYEASKEAVIRMLKGGQLYSRIFFKYNSG